MSVSFQSESHSKAVKPGGGHGGKGVKAESRGGGEGGKLCESPEKGEGEVEEKNEEPNILNVECTRI